MTRPGVASPRSHSIQYARSFWGSGGGVSMAGQATGRAAPGTVADADEIVVTQAGVRNGAGRARLVGWPARPLVLASASPARLGLLRDAGLAPGCRERHRRGRRRRPGARPRPSTRWRLRKAGAVADRLAGEAGPPGGHGRTLVVGCDSMLAIDGEVRGKPASPSRGPGLVAPQRGRAGTLLTGHAVVDTASGRTGRRARPRPSSTSARRPTPRSTPTWRPASRWRWPARSPSTAAAPLRRRHRRRPRHRPRPVAAAAAPPARRAGRRHRRPVGGAVDHGDDRRARTRDRRPADRALAVWPPVVLAPMAGHHQRPLPAAVPAVRHRGPRGRHGRRRPTPKRGEARARRPVRQRDDHRPAAWSSATRRRGGWPGSPTTSRCGRSSSTAPTRPRSARPCAHPGRRARRRPRRPQLRLPGRQGDPQGRRGRGAGAAGAVRRHRPGRGAGGRRRAGHREDAHRGRRPPAHVPRRRAHRGRARGPPPSPSTPARPSSTTAAGPTGRRSPPWSRPCGRPGARQRRRVGGRRRPADDGRDRLRRASSSGGGAWAGRGCSRDLARAFAAREPAPADTPRPAAAGRGARGAAPAHARLLGVADRAGGGARRPQARGLVPARLPGGRRGPAAPARRRPRLAAFEAGLDALDPAITATGRGRGPAPGQDVGPLRVTLPEGWLDRARRPHAAAEADDADPTSGG